MMGRSIKIEEEIKQLDEWIKTNPDSRELKRGLAVKMSLQGWLYTLIASTLNVSTSFISKWKNRFKQQGIAGLKLSYQGSQSYLTAQQKEEVLTWLKKQEYWDLSDKRCYLIDKFDVVFQSHASYDNLLKEAKIQ